MSFTHPHVVDVAFFNLYAQKQMQNLIHVKEHSHRIYSYIPSVLFLFNGKFETVCDGHFDHCIECCFMLLLLCLFKMSCDVKKKKEKKLFLFPKKSSQDHYILLYSFGTQSSGF